MKIIYEKDAIDALHKTMLDFFKTNDDDNPEFITASEKMLLSVNKAISKALKALPSAQLELANNSPKVDRGFGEWIPCSERLPSKDEQDESFLVTVQCEHMDGYPDYVVCGAEYSDYGWDYMPCPVGAIKVVAWMLITVEPYKERREE